MFSHVTFLLMIGLIFFQVTQTSAQRKKYRCVSERDQDQQRCFTWSTTPQPEPPRRILIRTQNKPKSPAASRPVIIMRRKQSSGQNPSSSSNPTSIKSLSFADDSKPSNPTTKFSPDSFSFLKSSLKFFFNLLSPLIESKAKHNASLPLVNVQVPMTFSMVHSAVPVAAATAYNPNNSPVICHTQCVYNPNNPSVPCGSDSQPCNGNAIISPTTVPCSSTSQPCNGNTITSPAATPVPYGSTSQLPCNDSSTASKTQIPCNSSTPQPCNGNLIASTTPAGGNPPFTSTNAPPITTASYPKTTSKTSTPAPYCDTLIFRLCTFLNENSANSSTILNCPTPCNSTQTTTAPPSGVVVDDETEMISISPPKTTSCATPTDSESKPTKFVDDTTQSDCTTREGFLPCLFHKTNKYKLFPLRDTAVKLKPSLCKHYHPGAPCLQHHHEHP